VHTLPSGETVFAGQRNDGFFVDLGAIFDLGDLRKFQHLHLIPSADAVGVDPLAKLNVHTIALQIPIKMLTRDGKVPSDAASSKSVLGIWAGASRRSVRLIHSHPHEGDNGRRDAGPWVQVSRLANPLFNEVVVPLGKKDLWNASDPDDDHDFAGYVKQPELARLLPVLYPGVFPNLAALNASGKVRSDLVAILLTGIPKGVVPGFQNSGGSTLADLLRLNMAIPPTTTKPSNIGLIGGDAAGFPNGRRVFDDVFTIELRALAGATYSLVDPTFTPDGAASAVTDGVTTDPIDQTAEGTVKFLPSFPYLGTPHSGYNIPALADAHT
jgi:hypothetical protein